MTLLISGSSGGIGAAIASKFLKEGYDVIGVDALPAPFSHPHYTHVLADVTKDELPEADPDILIVSHGTLDEEDAIRVNLEGAIRFSRKYEEGVNLKSVLYITSASARNGAEFPLYCASKAGLVGYMKNRATYLGKRGVIVNAIAPGAVLTSLNDHILKDERLFEAVTNESILKKWAKPEEIAEWAYFLTAINKSMTGEDLLIDNGEMLKSNFIW